MKYFLPACVVLAAVLFCGCASTEPQQKPRQEEEDPAVRKAREEWKKLVAEQREEERRRHDVNTLQNDKDRVFPWREGRRSERMHERGDSSVFSLW